jgi:hypothetical protein
MVIKRYNAILVSVWEYPNHDSEVTFLSGLNTLSVDTQYRLETSGSVFTNTHHSFDMSDWFFSFELQPCEKIFIMTVNLNKDEPTIYDQQFAIENQGVPTEEFLDAVLAGSKK